MLANLLLAEAVTTNPITATLQNTWFWVFNAVVVFLLAMDLFVFHRKAHVVSFKEAAGWSAFWVSLSLIFCGIVWNTLGPVSGKEFLTGYLIEYALSMDNIFVFVLIFTFFKVKAEFQHRVLFWGILGAIIMRATMILVGVAVVEKFSWTIPILGLFLIFTGIKMVMPGGGEVDLEKNFMIKLARRWLRMTPDYHGTKFVVKVDGVRMFTPLFLVLLVVETTDLVFAVDSIPAIMGVTRDPFIVYTSNICAILGLRSMYFMLSRGVDHFHYLKYGLSAVLAFVGTKMVLTWFDIHVDIRVSLATIFCLLAGSVTASLLLRKKES